MRVLAATVVILVLLLSAVVAFSQAAWWQTPDASARMARQDPDEKTRSAAARQIAVQVADQEAGTVKTLIDLSVVLQLAAAGISMGAAVYLARFKYTFIEELKKIFIMKPEEPEDMPLTRRQNNQQEQWAIREHSRFDDEFEKVWDAVSKKADK